MARKGKGFKVGVLAAPPTLHQVLRRYGFRDSEIRALEKQANRVAAQYIERDAKGRIISSDEIVYTGRDSRYAKKAHKGLEPKAVGRSVKSDRPGAAKARQRRLISNKNAASTKRRVREPGRRDRVSLKGTGAKGSRKSSSARKATNWRKR